LLALEQRELKFNEIVKITGNTTTVMKRAKDLQDAGLVGRTVLRTGRGACNTL
jgi:DNA-binding HxlR family transcriptional regulator